MKRLLLIPLLAIALHAQRVPTVNVTGTARVGTVYTAQNVALGAGYTMNPAPNYQYTTNAGDATELTDGALASTGSYMWVQADKAVGWRQKSLITITVDLGVSTPISGVDVSGAGGISEVSFPRAYFVLTSEDNSNWYFAGEVGALAWQTGTPTLDNLTTYTTNLFAGRGLQTRGRYVKLLVVPNAFYTVFDEVRIWSGSPDWTQQGWLTTSDEDTVAACMPNALLARRIRYDLDSLQSVLDGSGIEASASNEIRAGIVSAGTDAVTVTNTATNTVFPIGATHSNLFALQARLWRESGLSGLLLWQSNRWDYMPAVQLAHEESPSLDVRCATNDVRADGFWVGNAESTNQTVRFYVLVLGQTNPTVCSPYVVDHTDTHWGIPVASGMTAISEVDDRYSFTVSPGLSRQVWLSFCPTNIAAGTNTGSVVVETAYETNTIPLTFVVYPFSLPDELTLALGGWDYTDQTNVLSLTETNRTSVLAFLDNYNVDSPWCATATMPNGTYDASGNMTVAPTLTRFTNWVNMWPSAKRYYVYKSFTSTFGGLTQGTDAWGLAMTNWCDWWHSNLIVLGISTQVVIHAVDESYSAANDLILSNYNTVIAQAQPDFVLWSNPDWNPPSAGNTNAYESCEELCGTMRYWQTVSTWRPYYTNLQADGRALQLYTPTLPARIGDPSLFWRQMGWSAFRDRMTGIHIWSFIDCCGDSSWDEYRASETYNNYTDYCPQFLDLASVSTSRQMEAIREGRQDYEYMHLLDTALSAYDPGETNEIVVAGRALVATAPGNLFTNANTVSKLFWYNAAARGTNDYVARQVADILGALP
jgi:hypothetical protein